MHTFRYKATNQSGVDVKGNIVASDEAEALQMLQDDELLVLDFRKLHYLEAVDVGSLLPVPLAQIEEFYRQMAFLMQAGIPLDMALKEISKQIKHKKFKEAILTIAKGLSEGVKFSEGIAKFSGIFPPVAVSMIMVAEENGDYDTTFMNLADYFKRLREMRGKLIGALGYPIFMFIFAIGVTFFLSTTIIPQIAGNLTEAGGELPPLTQIVVKVANNFVPIFIVLILFIGSIIGAWIYIKTKPDIKAIVDKRILLTPFVGSIVMELQQARFCDSTSTLLNGGIPISGALNIVGKAMTNEAMKRVILLSGEELKKGKRLSYTLEDSGIFSGSLILVTAIGEKTGKMDEAFHLLAKKYEAETDALLKRIVGVITPVTILLLAVMVGAVALALIQAMNALMRAY